MFQHTAARRRLEDERGNLTLTLVSFNTQPPEGGWLIYPIQSSLINCFNTQPPEGGWTYIGDPVVNGIPVSTHSRPKAAGAATPNVSITHAKFGFNTQPPEGGWRR